MRCNKIVFILCFISFSTLLRSFIDFNLNNDYFLYYKFEIFHKPTSFLSYLLNEPYLYSLYAFLTFFIENKEDIFKSLYWFNFLVSSAFFIWLLYREDLEVWKKMLLFTLYYFLFSFVLLRNAPVYILFAIYFYYTFRDKKFNYILLTPLMHVSSLLILTTYFYKSKKYTKVLLIAPIFIILLFIIAKPFLSTIPAFDSILSKIEIYSAGMAVIGFIHILFFLFICLLVFLGFCYYKSQMLHPILLTLIFFYIVTFFINPIAAHRLSPYLLFALLLYPFKEIHNPKIVLIINRLTVTFFPIFLYSLINTHSPTIYTILFPR